MPLSTPHPARRFFLRVSPFKTGTIGSFTQTVSALITDHAGTLFCVHLDLSTAVKTVTAVGAFTAGVLIFGEKRRIFAVDRTLNFGATEQGVRTESVDAAQLGYLTVGDRTAILANKLAKFGAGNFKTKSGSSAQSRAITFGASR
jgi:hypothetical protein